MRIPILFTNHTRYDLYLQTYLPMLPEGLGETFLQAYLPSFCRAVELVVSPSLGMASVLRRLGVDAPIDIVPNGVNLECFRESVAPIPREAFGFLAENLLLIYVGRLAPEKNLHFLLSCFAGIVKAYPHVRLLLIGEGSEREALEKQARLEGVMDKICFTGLIPYDNLPAYLASCDAFITASITEVHPLSLIEAMACGLPVLGIDSPGIGDTIVDGVTGLLSGPNIASFTAKLALLVNEADLRIHLGTAARQAVGRFDIECTSQMMLDRYEKLTYQAAHRRKGFRYYWQSQVERWRK